MSDPAVSEAISCACHDTTAAPAPWWRIGVGALIAANAMTISLALNTSRVTAGEAQAVHALLLGLAVASLIVLGWPLARNATRALAARRISIEAMFVAGIVGALTGSLIAAASGTGESYFEIVPILLVVYSFGQRLVGHVQDRALRAVLEWAPELGRCLVVDEEGEVREIPISQLKAGQRVMVPTGAVVSADGVVESGEAFVREAEMTGEPFVVVKRPGMVVWAGTQCIDASLIVRATSDGCERRIDRILGAVEAARARPATLQAQADRMVARLLPMVLAVAALTLAGWLAAAGWREGVYNAMAVLLVACPCALGLATPLAVWVAIARMASRGLVVHGGQVVEALAAVDTAVFDKTGTITEPTTRLVDIVTEPATGSGRDRLLRLIAAVQRTGDHPVATAFADLATSAPGEWRVESLETMPGVGVRAAVVPNEEGRAVMLEIGTADRLIDDRLQESWRRLRSGIRALSGVREIAVVLDRVPVAAAAVDERLRESWPEALDSLRALGMSTVVLTGDRADRAGRVGADVAVAELGPEGKLERVVELAREGRRVLFVGDGVNDAAAMAASDVSIGAAAGAALAAEVADVVWHGIDLRAIPWAMEVARRAVATIRSNLLIAVLYNFVGISLAVAGVLHPVAAALLMTGSSVVVTLRAIRPLHDEQVEAEERAREVAAPGSLEPARS